MTNKLLIQKRQKSEASQYFHLKRICQIKELTKVNNIHSRLPTNHEIVLYVIVCVYFSPNKKCQLIWYNNLHCKWVLYIMWKTFIRKLVCQWQFWTAFIEEMLLKKDRQTYTQTRVEKNSEYGWHGFKRWQKKKIVSL